MESPTLHILGCGSAKPTLRHNPSCSVLKVREALYMIDCGEGAQRAMLAQGLRFHRLNNIFLTHLHGDHILGLPGLLSTLAMSGKEGYITVHTFAAGIRWLQEQMRFFGGTLGYELRFNEIDPRHPALIHEDKNLTVRTVPLRHRIDCVGFVFEERSKPRHIDRPACDFHKVPIAFLKNLQSGEDFVKPDGTVVPNSWLTKDPTHSASYAHIGDTAYDPALAPLIGPVDLLYHETTYTAEHIVNAKERGHSTAAQAASMASECGAGRLLTGHYSSRYKDEKEILAEAKAVFPDTILGREGLVVKL